MYIDTTVQRPTLPTPPSAPVDGADVEEVLAVLAECVPGRLVHGLQVHPEGVAVAAERAAEVTPALLGVEDDRGIGRRRGRGCFWLLWRFGLWKRERERKKERSRVTIAIILLRAPAAVAPAIGAPAAADVAPSVICSSWLPAPSPSCPCWWSNTTTSSGSHFSMISSGSSKLRPRSSSGLDVDGSSGWLLEFRNGAAEDLGSSGGCLLLLASCPRDDPGVDLFLTFWPSLTRPLMRSASAACRKDSSLVCSTLTLPR